MEGGQWREDGGERTVERGQWREDNAETTVEKDGTYMFIHIRTSHTIVIKRLTPTYSHAYTHTHKNIQKC